MLAWTDHKNKPNCWRNIFLLLYFYLFYGCDAGLSYATTRVHKNSSFNVLKFQGEQNIKRKHIHKQIMVNKWKYLNRLSMRQVNVKNILKREYMQLVKSDSYNVR